MERGPWAEIDRFDPTVPIEEAWMPPSSWYTSTELAALERRSVFATEWLAVARRDELRAAGSVRSGCIAGEPWLLVRGGDGELRGFHNVCRHKANLLVAPDDRANRDEIVCGYHGWRYDLAGRLTSAPRVGGIRDFDRAAMSLAPLQVACWGPFVFVCHRPRTRLAEQLADLTPVFEATGWDQLVHARTLSWTLECNWKVYVDNYLDGGYHVPHMHPSLAEQIDMESYSVELGPSFSIQSCPSGADAKGRIGQRALYAFIYPNFMLNRYGACLDSNVVVPLGPDRCRVDYDFFFAPELGSGAIEQSIEQSRVTQGEDIAISEAVQRGLGSSAYDRGRYAPRVELAEHHFHRLLHRSLTSERARLGAVQDETALGDDRQ